MKELIEKQIERLGTKWPTYVPQLTDLADGYNGWIYLACNNLLAEESKCWEGCFF